MIIVESNEEIIQFLHDWNNKCAIIYPIWVDLDKHPMNNELCLLYVKFQDSDFILPFNHNDCEPLSINLSQSTQKKKVFNKKGLLQTNLGISNIYDIQTDESSKHNKIINPDTFIEVLTNFYHRLGVRSDLGKTIPIMKWMEVLNELTNTISWDFIDSWINSTMIPILSDIERRGIRVDRKKFINKWPFSKKHLKDDIVYTEYNPYTLTSRPSNRHGGINYSALNKKDGSREIFIPRDGKTFLQFDYDAYHVRIIGKLVKYDLPKTSVHQWLADQYGCSYEESKRKTFQILYGGVTDEYKKIPFFKQVDDYIQKMYIEAEKKGYIETPHKRKIMLNWIDTPTSAKVFNYLLQAIETECNITVMKKLSDIGIDSLNLYLYDSFLFEYDSPKDVENIEQDIFEPYMLIKEILESLGFPVKATWGSDYSKV